MAKMADQVALVTGATSGIGRAIARAFAAEGATVVIHGRDEARAAAVVAEIDDAGGKASQALGDLRESGAAEAVVDTALARHGRLDVLVNNAGVMSMAPVVELDAAQIDDVLAVNLRAPMLVTARAFPALVESRGSVINVTTGGAHRGAAGAGLYAASKAGLHLLTLSWAGEFAPYGVRANELVPGVTETPMTAPMLQAPEVREMVRQQVPLGRVADTTDIAAAAVFLASSEAHYVTGAVLAVDGGFLAT